jgi:hypothetical protein
VPEKPVIGWREWVAFPDLGIRAVKAKIDTGARTSSIHAFDIETFQRRGHPMVRFRVHPYQRDARVTVETTAPVLETRRVRSSTGHDQVRIVVLADVELLGMRWPIELTLASRDSMGFRLLLGRQALRRRFVVDPGRSYRGGRHRRRGRRLGKPS